MSAVSSAYKEVSGTSLGKSLIYKLNNRGPNIEPCGTPERTVRGLEYIISTATIWS